MSSERVRNAVREAVVPDGNGARERAWRVVSAAYEEDGASIGGRGARRRLWARPAITLAVLVAAVVVAITPPGEAVGDWIADTLRPAVTPSQPVLSSLPTGGRLLVTSGQGPWIVQPDGSKRRLGDYDEAGWSPRGLFVVATSGRQLVTLEPGGDVRWTLSRPRLVKAPSWSPDGFRIAYLSGEDLRVVAGDGTGDAKLGSDPAVRTPAWRPGEGHVLAWVSTAGRVTVIETDTARTLWQTEAGEPPRSLAWTADARRLVAVFRERVEVFSAAGRRIRTVRLPAGARARSATMHPTEPTTLGLVRYRPAADRSEAVALNLATGRARRLFAGARRFDDLAWSPDGRWLLVSWRDADQWLFLHSAERAGVKAISNVSRQFDPGGKGPAAFPRVSGWCCPSPPHRSRPIGEPPGEGRAGTSSMGRGATLRRP